MMDNMKKKEGVQEDNGKGDLNKTKVGNEGGRGGIRI